MNDFEFINHLPNAFRLVIEQHPCIVISDRLGRYVYVNKGWEDLTGYTFEEVKGKRIKDFVKSTRIEDVLATEKPILGYQTEINSGRQFNSAFPLYGDDGNLIGAAVATLFSNPGDALDFSHYLYELVDRMEYYKKELRKLQGARHSIDEIAGSGHAVTALKEQILSAALTTSTVLIEGETGSGKELVANAIHDLSNRSEKPFIKINCSAIPPALVESELFGYDTGAFTGAVKGGKKGLFELADTGSLFLDEINQMPYFMQPKLLRALQEREIRHVGGSSPIPVDTRIIAATNKDLLEMIAKNRFREDLYYRINVVTIRIPPLRERLEDIPEILDASRQRLNYELGMHVEGVTAEVEERLKEYSWPGNVRELNNVLERAMNVKNNGVLSWDCFKDYFESHSFAAKGMLYNNPVPPVSFNTDNDDEKRRIIRLLEKNHYNKSLTARDLGLSRTALYNKLKKYDL